MSLEFALKDGPQPERSIYYPGMCPKHDHGDEARLDYFSAGWPDGQCKQHRGKCKRVWRSSVLCDALFQEVFCEKALPDNLRRIMQASSGPKVTATSGKVTASGGA
jgi:hypothetical protein